MGSNKNGEDDMVRLNKWDIVILLPLCLIVTMILCALFGPEPLPEHTYKTEKQAVISSCSDLNGRAYEDCIDILSHPRR